MSNSLVSLAALGLLLGTCGLAWWRGGQAEKWGAACLLAAWIGELVWHAVSSQAFDPRWIFLTSDTLLATAFLFLALRFSSGWLAAAMVLQGMALSLHALRWAESGASARPYIALINLISLLVLLSISAGTVSSWRKHRQLGRNIAAGIPKFTPAQREAL